MLRRWLLRSVVMAIAAIAVAALAWHPPAVGVERPSTARRDAESTGEVPGSAAIPQSVRVEVASGTKAAEQDAVYGWLEVVDPRGAPVAGAEVRITRPGESKSLAGHSRWTDERGRVHVPEAIDEVLDVGVDARGYVPWFRANAMGPMMPSITATLGYGQRIQGWVSTGSGRAPGVRVRLAARFGAPPPIADFIAQDATADVGAEGDLRSSTHSREEVTDQNGSFTFAGLDPEWICALVVDDPRWMLCGPPVVVKPGAIGVELKVAAPTSLEIHCRPSSGTKPLRGAMHALVRVRDSAGSARSFSFGGSASPLILRYLSGGDWVDPLSYEVELRGEGWSAQGACAGHMARSTRLDIEAGEGRTDTRDCLSVRLFVQWPSGELCEGPLHVWADDQNGKPVRAAVLGRGDDGSYSVSIDRAGLTARVLADNCWRSPGLAPRLDLRGVVDGDVLGVMMPQGATLLITLPGAQRTAVQLVGPGGVKIAEVQGAIRFQGVEAGTFTATCEVAGQVMTRSTEVAGSGEFHLNFAQ